jgi:CHAT domain-containing protein
MLRFPIRCAPRVWTWGACAPTELRDGPPARLIVSAEGSIARLPFEALDLGMEPRYEPLLARHEVLYARPVPLRHRRAGDGSTIILLGGDEGSGRGSTVATLAATENEAAQASTWLPGPRTVRSDEISKQALLDAWSRASVIYVAAHLVRDREAPLLCYFPMTFGARPNYIEDTYLDLLDARSVDLTGCELAVLSSCASGEPYVIGGRAGPSMADVMLDAGATAVIHTRWQVRDDRAAVVAPRLARAWLEARHDPVMSWCAERRKMLHGPSGLRHPFEWAAWSVTVAMPTRPWGTEDKGVIAAGVGPAPSAPGPPAGSGGPFRSRR